MAPMKAAIEATVNPARQGSVAQPQAADVEKLRQHCAVMTAAAAELQQVLSQDTRTAETSDGGTGGCFVPKSQNSSANAVQAKQRSEAEVLQLEETCQKLKDEVASLEGQGARADDLEEVAASLRRRVAELRAEEAKAAALRNECRELRFQIAELVASVVDDPAAEREELKVRLQGLSQGGC
ncbi:unnamed protein product [Symbiodinium microadriaticum]|nr:unnamed protein product [Symbiodinium microadriaticum]